MLRSNKALAAIISVFVGAQISMYVYHQGWLLSESPLEEEQLTTNYSINSRCPLTNQSSAPALLTEGAFPCMDRKAATYGRVEDLFCTILPKRLPEVKNPCFYDYIGLPLPEGGGVVKKLRCLPHFHVIGMGKCGTTDMYTRIRSHPHYVSNNGVIKKEPSYWAWRRHGRGDARGKKWTLSDYIDLFNPIATLLTKNLSLPYVTGDASPMDMYDLVDWPSIPQNQGREEPVVLIPHLMRHVYASSGYTPKLIVQLREPAARIFSLYVFRGHKPSNFHKDVIVSLEMINKCTKTKSRRVCYMDKRLQSLMPVNLQSSCYSVFLREWLDVFPREAFLFTRLEDSTKDMAKSMKDIFKFLQLDPLPEDNIRAIGRMKKVYATKGKVGKVIAPETALLLAQFYKTCKEETAQILQDDRFLWKDV